MFKLAIKANSLILDKAETNISGSGAVTAGKGFTLFVSDKDVDDIIKIARMSLEDSGLLTDDAIVTVKHEIKKKKVDFLVL